MEKEVLRKLLLRHFEGNATPAQLHMLKEALADPAKQQLYYEVLHEWETANPQILPDTESGWASLSERLASRSENQEAGNSAGRIVGLAGRRQLWWAAAALILLSTIAAWKRDDLLYRHYTTGYGETKAVTLSDGSKVTLNANSELRFSRFAFLKNIREASLKGEADFSVKHLEDHRPFVIRTEDSLQVKVLGTSFLVYSRHKRSKVVLTEGSIELRSLKTNLSPVLIKPGEIVNVGSDGALNIAVAENTDQYFLWKDNRFFFDQTPLRDIAAQVRERFGVELKIRDPQLAAVPISGNYPAGSVDEIVSMLCKLLNLKHTKLNDQSILLQKI